MDSLGDTLIDVFVALSSNPDMAEEDVVQCAGETWTYGDLHTISSGVALVIGKKYGPRPTVALICENHPYMIVLLLAVWKLGGIVAPFDSHAPADLMEAMLLNIAPTYVVIPALDLVNKQLIQDLKISVELLEPEEVTITALSQRFLHLSSYIPPEFCRPSQPDDVCLYIHTSSASSGLNLKCVPLTHGSLISNGRAQLNWFHKNLPGESFDRLRVLGWSPFSHIMSICFDLGTSVFLTGGCYIFALTPSTYFAMPNIKSDGQYDVPTLLLEAILEQEPNVFAGVPWVLDGLMTAWNAEHDVERRARISAALKNFKYIISAGAATNEGNIQWAKRHGFPVFISIGMTELGGVLFHAHVSEAASGWSIIDSCIPDAVFTLVDENGEITNTEGELYITSRNISRGYLKYESTSFTEDESGLVTFRTGDMYVQPSDGRLVWKGRKDDFIQLISGESLDPRLIEKTLNACSVVAHSCVVGNMFLSAAAGFVCAIIELTSEGAKNIRASRAQVTKAIGAINRSLAPPLRIAWSRVLFLDEGEHIPYTRKHTIFRKKLQALFEDRLAVLSTKIVQPENNFTTNVERPQLIPSSISVLPKDIVEKIVFNVVANTLGLSADIMESNSQSVFAELGMDSAMATVIINTLNQQLSIALPPNACHTHVDLTTLTSFVFEKLGIVIPTALPILKGVGRKSCHQEPIVIVGQALRLPGDINTPDTLWKALIDKRQDIMINTPHDRWDHASFQRDPSCRITSEKAGFIDIATFDHAFFGISSAEAFFVSPTVRLALETAFEALENANIPISRVKGTNMGVFVAAGLDPGYSELLYYDKGYDAYSRFYGTGVAISTACGRLSYLLDIHGPSITVETACSGGLVALDQAVRHLQSGRGESAIVCGVNTHTLPGMFGFLSAQKMTSPNSRCATFTNEADGYAASEGVVSVIVKTKSAALRDGDTILGIIKATDTMHNGRTQGLVAPSIKAQVLLQRSLLELSSLNPADIDFIEAHGTGTALGDLIEIQAINEVFRSSHTPSRPLIIGAAKSCLGHTETTSGLLGLVKALLSFSNKAVPGLTHLNEANMNPDIDCSLIPMQIPCHPVSLKGHPDEPYRSLVAAYGFAGTISGLVLEAPSGVASPKHKPMNLSPSLSSPLLFVVSAKTQQALLGYIQAYLDFCCQAPEASFPSICYTACVGREHYRHRFACVVNDMQHLIHQLKDKLSRKTQSPKLSTVNLLLGFPGQGSQFKGMAKDLADQYSGFRAILTKYADMASDLAGYSILSLLLGTTDCNLDIDQSQIAQICIFVYQCSVCKWLGTLGIWPQAVLGHSLGEIAAAVSAGAFDYADGLQFVYARAEALKADPSYPGTMAAIAAPEVVISQYIKTLGVGNSVVIAVSNGAESHVISGAATAVDLVYHTVKQDGIRCAKMKVDQGFHSPCIEGALSILRTWFENGGLPLQPLNIPYYSTLLAKKIPPKQYLDSNYWVEHAKRPVKFWQTVLKISSETSPNIVLDIGPQPFIWTSMQCPELADRTLLATTTKRGNDQGSAFLEVVASLFEHNMSLELQKIYDERRQHFSKITIPTYPFQRQRYYPSFIPSRNVVPSHMDTNQPTKATVELISVDQSLLDLLHDHRIEGRQVLPGVAFGDLLARLSLNSSRHVQSVRFHQPLVLESLDTLVQTSFAADGSFKIFQNGSSEEKDRLCSGSFLPPKNPYFTKKVVSDIPPSRIVSREQVYAPFEGNIHFGPAFRNVVQISMWSDHVDALISVLPSSNADLDRIRKLDPCLHMFGALSQFVDVPGFIRKEGLVLPTSLEGFTLHTDSLPSEFVCRYFLPFNITHSYRSISVAFEVLSLSEELLVSCRSYSVAWLPKGVAIQAPISALPSQWFKNTWRQEDILPQPISQKLAHRDEIIVYFGSAINLDILSPFVTAASDVIIVELKLSERRYIRVPPSQLEEKLVPFNNASTELLEELVGKNISIILDTSSCCSAPGSEPFSAFWKHAIWLMKLTMSGRFHVSSFVVISCLSVPTGTIRPTAPPPGVNAVIQGILRVYRRELGLNRDTVWGLDLPEDLSASTISNIIADELAIRRNMGAGSSSIVAYQKKSTGNTHSIVRLVPVLLAAPQKAMGTTLSGVAVVVGMGGIGYTLASYLVTAGCSTVIFMGRRPANDSTIINDLIRIRTSSPGIFDYIQSDASNISSVRNTFSSINMRFGSIKHIIHTAGVISDATINVVTDQEIERVLQPKVMGAWNLHHVDQEMKLDLDSFVLLSSISVPLGNPGQAAYVGANSFLDSLATYRQSIGLNGLSLQLGAWESQMVEGLDLSKTMVFTMRHEEGMPLIMKALETNDPVQVIANLDLEQLAHNPTLAGDPIYRELFMNDKVKNNKRASLKTLPSEVEVKGKIIETLRALLELGPDEQLDLEESLTSYGMDSIAFAQARGRVLQVVGVDIPMLYLSDAFSINDMISGVSKGIVDIEDPAIA